MLDNVEILVTGGLHNFKKCLGYTKQGGHRDKYGRFKRTAVPRYVMRKTGDGYCFYAGLLPRVLEYCKAQGVHVDIQGGIEYIEPSKPRIKGIELFDVQKRLVTKAIKANRGLLISPTGSGKTILAMAICSAFPDCKILFLTPSISIMTQTVKEFKAHDFNVTAVGSGQRDLTGDVVVSTVQSYRRLPMIDLADEWDVVIVDEIHLMSKSLATLEQILSTVLAPVRIGLTAKLPTSRERRLVLEGILGPVIDKVDLEEATNMDILAEVDLKLVPVPVNRDLLEYKSYKQIYQKCLIENRARNRLAAQETKRIIQEGRTVIIFIRHLDHIQHIGEELNDLGVVYHVVEGNTASVTREKIRHLMEQGRIKCVIASAVWREGVNIKSLGGVILLLGGKSEDALIQYVGRGLRKAKGKNKAVIVDFLDPYPYLAEHCVSRLTVYASNQWL